MANPPRITDADIAVYGGTLSGFIEGLLEAVRTAPMEEKERAAGMLHALADQARENADTIFVALLRAACSRRSCRPGLRPVRRTPPMLPPSKSLATAE